MKWLKGKDSVGDDRLANKIAAFISKVQQSFANLMTRVTKDLSSASLKWTLALFISFGTVCSIYIAVAALSSKKNSIKVSHLQTPGYLVQDDQEKLRRNISKAEYEQLLKFERYLDSLRKTSPKLYDTIMKGQPGLIDSIKLLESLYDNQIYNQK